MIPYEEEFNVASKEQPNLDYWTPKVAARVFWTAAIRFMQTNPQPERKEGKLVQGPDRGCEPFRMLSTPSASPAAPESDPLAAANTQITAPCPFCGATVACVEDDEEAGTLRPTGMYHVICDFNANGCGSSTGFQLTPQKAIQLWNKAKCPTSPDSVSST